jgi:hypothetical protein
VAYGYECGSDVERLLGKRVLVGWRRDREKGVVVVARNAGRQEYPLCSASNKRVQVADKSIITSALPSSNGTGSLLGRRSTETLHPGHSSARSLPFDLRVPDQVRLSFF